MRIAHFSFGYYVLASTLNNNKHDMLIFLESLAKKLEEAPFPFQEEI